MSDTPKEAIFRRLCEDGAEFHGWEPDVFTSWALSEPALRLILDRVRPGDRTLETGCGYSTVVFALAGAEHTVVSPDAFEHDRIRAWCGEAGVDLERVTFVARRSQEVLPQLGNDPLDFVLIDGDHAFPVPFIDWYFAAERLRPGGQAMIDDTHLRTGEILRDFLRAETARWRRTAAFPTAEVFEKLGSDVLDRSGWCAQPYCASPRRVPGLGPSRWQELRSRVRLRSRARAVLGRAASPMRATERQRRSRCRIGPTLAQRLRSLRRTNPHRDGQRRPAWPGNARDTAR